MLRNGDELRKRRKDLAGCERQKVERKAVHTAVLTGLIGSAGTLPSLPRH